MAAMDERLPPQDWMQLPATRAVMAALEAAGGEGCARFVGGCVRDALLGRIAPGAAGLDIDIATPLTPDQVTAALETAGLRAAPTGIAHGTMTAIAHGRPFEVTTLRRDVETDGRHAVVAFSTDWAEDAARRDFRMNALYADAQGRLFDPTGGGVADARAGRVVFVGAPETRIREDYLRILRFFRFSAGYGRGAPDAAALAACAALKAGIAGLSGERIARELRKLLAAPDPRAAVTAMTAAGVLAACAPGLPDAVAGLARFDALVALQARLGEPADAVLRLSALLPDDAGALAAASARLRLSNADRERLAASASQASPVAAGWSAPERRRAVRRLGPARTADRARLAWAADPDPEGAEGWAALLQLARSWTPPAFPLTGADVKAAGAGQGPAVGRALRALEAWWEAEDFAPDRAALLARLPEVLAASPERR